MLPFEPHAKFPCIVGVTQKPWVQQPEQVPGPHAELVQAPLTHCWLS
jgi:hypothetical protein